MKKVIIFALMTLIIATTQANLKDKYDLRRMPFDLRPVQKFIGLWELRSTFGRIEGIPPPDIIDFAINPLPKFGARALNITHTHFDRNKQTIRSDYGFMPVKNATRRDPRVHLAYLTSSSDGFSMMEQGVVRRNTIRFHLKQYLSRSFAVGHKNGNFQIDGLEREFTVNKRRLDMIIQSMTSKGDDDYMATYAKVLL